MAFPTNPTDGQEYNNYIYNESLDLWKKKQPLSENHTHSGGDVTSQVSDSDTVDGYDASELARLAETNNFTSMPSAGGDPIVESGSNSNGEWTRWADGTQMCYGEREVTGVDINDSSGIGGYHGSAGDFDYPRSFVETPTVVIGHVRGAFVQLSTLERADMDHATVRARSISSLTNETVWYTFSVTGRWK